MRYFQINWLFKTLALALFIIGFVSIANAQKRSATAEFVYDADIKSVKLYPSNNPLSPAICGMNGPLTLSFDDFSEDGRNLDYTVYHCTRNWEISDLETFDYLEGFESEDIDNYQSSINTVKDYVHYNLQLPNRDVRWTISGNYLLVITDEDTEEVLFTRRFIVSENRTGIQAELRRPTRLAYSSTHHEVSFQVNLKYVPLDNPRLNVKATVMQNNDWAHAISDIEPRSYQGDLLKFDFNNKIVFPSQRSFRLLDLRSLYGNSANILSIERFTKDIKVIVRPERFKKYNSVLETDYDIDGQFVITNNDKLNHITAAEYVTAKFSIQPPEYLLDDDVYIVGSFNDYRTDEESRLQYTENNMLEIELPLKQGVYNYGYVTKPKGDPDMIPDYSETEGLDFRANHKYYIILYYKPITSRYDQVIGYALVER